MSVRARARMTSRPKKNKERKRGKRKEGVTTHLSLTSAQ
jgi:hypothetical protein